ncbi:hypothetical protein HBI24_120700 [Parastagonospora nodorum]|nr:hypothetical protein HBI24_120700 [Parastagonospora nodorum]
MDWLRDNVWLAEQDKDLDRIFSYAPAPTLVLKIVENNGYRMQIWSLETDDDWAQWLRAEACEDKFCRGLVLILARRAEENFGHFPKSRAMTYKEWFDYDDANGNPRFGLRCAQTFASLAEKQQDKQGSPKTKPNGRQASINKLPVSHDTFKSICLKFRVHGSITKTMTRTTSPSFHAEGVAMDQEAYVINCRTSKAWPSDMALSATCYPEQGLTYAILYGCTPVNEKSIVQKLNNISDEASHPLLIPGIFAELELVRITRQVGASIVDVESKIFALDFQSGDTEGLGQEDFENRHEAKRRSWLNMTYLNNSLITQTVQIHKMAKLAVDLGDTVYASNGYPTQSSALDETQTLNGSSDTVVPEQVDVTRSVNEAFFQRMRYVGKRIELRLNTIREEYENKIRDCTMRVEGMAMATQWSHSETAVEMALATNRESRVMTSISLVTMVFLPGTFFATVFSMTFFDWSGDSGQGRVSSYVWVYVVVTIFFTAVTVGLWYFFVIYRRGVQMAVDEEK